jgi:hypothetical protein
MRTTYLAHIILLYFITLVLFLWFTLLRYYRFVLGARGNVVVKALCYKPEGRGFETR